MFESSQVYTLTASQNEQKDQVSKKHLVIDHFTVVCSVTWPLDGSEAGVDLGLIQTSLLLLCKTRCSDAN